MPISDAKPVVENRNGRIEIIPGDEVRALSWGVWRFRWTLGFDVEPGGGMEIVFVPRFPTNRWSLPQTADPTAPGHVTARADGDTSVSVNVLRWPLMQKAHGATLHIIQVGVGGRTMEKGEVIEVTYGEQSGGSLGVQAQLSAREVAFPIFVADGQAPRFFERFVSWDRQTDVATLREQSDFNPSLRVVGGAAASFHVVAPMEVSPWQPFDVRLTALDRGCNAAADYEGVVDVATTDPAAGRFPAIAAQGANAVIPGIVLHTPGFHRLYAVDANRTIVGVSNPIRVMPDARPLYWGEIHGHSEQSDGNGTPDEHYVYARDVALLDFACVADHDKHLYEHPDRWRVAVDKVKEYSREGEFVAVLGYEGRLRDRVGVEAGGDVPGSEPFGDINVYYATDDEDMLPPFHIPLTPAALDGANAIVVPHSPLYGQGCNMGTHWRFLKDMPAHLMPLVEVFSTHGASEYYDCPRRVLWQAPGRSAVEALKMGFRLGMIGSSDYHEVLTGSLLRIQDTPRTVNNRHMQARCGLAAVRAPELTRAALFDALKNRRTFATSGIRAYVDFSINGHAMGEEFVVGGPTAPRRLSLAVAAPERIVKLEVIRNGESIADVADGSWFVETEVTDEDPIPEGAFYYLRVTSERTDFAWSSPIWVDVEG